MSFQNLRCDRCDQQMTSKYGGRFRFNTAGKSQFICHLCNLGKDHAAAEMATKATPAPVYTSTTSGLTADEQAICEHTVAAYNGFVQLPDLSATDQHDVTHAINTLQRILAGRVVARDYPQHWR